MGLFNKYFIAAFSLCTLHTENLLAINCGSSNDWIGITSGPGHISLGVVDVLDGIESQGSTQFVIKACSPKVVYTVWLSVPEENLDNHFHLWRLKNGDSFLPVRVSLNGNFGFNMVNASPAKLQTGSPHSARPHSGRPIDGDRVSGTDKLFGTIYTITLSEDNISSSAYPDMPSGTYTLIVTAHVDIS